LQRTGVSSCELPAHSETYNRMLDKPLKGLRDMVESLTVSEESLEQLQADLQLCLVCICISVSVAYISGTQVRYTRTFRDYRELQCLRNIIRSYCDVDLDTKEE
jgi:hypothetical protein